MMLSPSLTFLRSVPDALRRSAVLLHPPRRLGNKQDPNQMDRDRV